MRFVLMSIIAVLFTFKLGAQTPSAGCGKDNPPNGNLSIEVPGGSEPRDYIIQLPNNYNPETPYAVVFGYHGRGATAQAFSTRYYGGLGPAVADEAIAVFPQGLGDPSSWSEEEDIPFFDAMLAELASTTCIDMGMIFSMGHSMGGFWTNTLGCQRGDILRGIGPISGAGPFTFNSPECVGKVAAWVGHGAVDSVVLLTSGEGSRDYWAEQNNCDLSSELPDPHPDCITYAGCDEDYPVNWCVFDAGHDPDDPLWMGEGVWGFFRTLSSLTETTTEAKKPSTNPAQGLFELLPHPNAVEGNLILRILSPQLRRVSLSNINGRYVYQSSLIAGENNYELRIPVSHLAEGVYLLEGEADSRSMTQKIILKR